MGKTIVYIVLLGFLGFGVYYFLIRSNDSLYNEPDANFSFKDTSVIGKIFLVETNGQSILVERNEGENWILNKQYPAMPVQLVNILTCLKLQTAFKPVSARDHDRVIKLLAGLSTKVEVYDRKGNKMRSFYVAGQGPNYHGSYMIMEGAKQAYLVEIPGFEGYLTPRYSTELNDWRSRSVFSLTPDSISSISVNYPSEPLNSFTVKNDNGKHTVTIAPELSSSFNKLNEKRVNDYLSFFKRINAEGNLNGTPGLDTSIGNAILRCKMEVTATSGKRTALDIYWIDQNSMKVSLADQTSTDPNNRPKDVERMYAVNQTTKDTLLIQALMFEKLFRVSYEFYQDGSEQQPVRPQILPLNKKKAPINYAK